MDVCMAHFFRAGSTALDYHILRTPQVRRDKTAREQGVVVSVGGVAIIISVALSSWVSVQGTQPGVIDGKAL